MAIGVRLRKTGIAFDEALVVNVLEMTNAAAGRRGYSTKSSRTASSVSTMCAPPSSMRLRENAECASEPLSVISIDNQPFITDVIEPSLTTLELPHYEMGFEAIRQLVACLTSDKAVADLSNPIGWHGGAETTRWRQNGIALRVIERDSIVL